VKTCKACGNEARKLRRAYVVSKGPGLVCTRCEANGLLVVPPRQPTVVRKVEKNSDDLKRAIADIQRLVTAKRAGRRPVGVGSVAEDNLVDAQIEGLESALQVLRRGRPS
jgi:hypothetical protein